jgi:short-subunit dehydrogenase
MKNHDTIALITGAAGGIGSVTAHTLHQQGYTVWLVDVNEAGLKKLHAAIPTSRMTICDLKNEESVQKLCAEIAEIPHLSVAFLNAAMISPGMTTPGKFIDQPLENIDAQIQVNLVSCLHLNHVCGLKMKAQGEGHIINTVSMGGIISMKDSATYSATKFGLRGFLMAFSVEMRPFGCSVSGIYPSAVDTQALRFEATHPDGSPLNFLSPPMKADDVAQCVLKAIKTKRLEYYLPYTDSLTSKLFGSFPNFLHIFYPMFEKMGEKGRKKFIQHAGL